MTAEIPIETVEHQLEMARRDLADANESLGFAKNRLNHAETQRSRALEQVSYWEGVLGKVSRE